jgi:branched-chain amino acid aminotransferase
VKLRNSDGREIEMQATGDGPVDAALKAIERATGVEVVLRKFEVRSVSAGEDAQGEALVYVEYNQRTYRGSSVSTNIVESATQAFLEVINRIEQAQDALSRSRDERTGAARSAQAVSRSSRSFPHAHTRNEIHLVQRQAGSVGKATVHVLSHACTTAPRYSRRARVRNAARPAIFRLRDHTRRCSIRPRCTASTARSRKIRSITPAARSSRRTASRVARTCGQSHFAVTAKIGVVPKIDPPVEVAIAAWEWGKYLGAAEDEGVDVCVSSWQRVAPNTIPAMAKAAGNYLSSQLIGLEAKRLGFVEGIGLSPDGTVSEGAGENLFVIKDGVVYTPGIAHSVLGGITRHTVMTLAKDAGIEVREIGMPREFCISPTRCSSPAPRRKWPRSARWMVFR